MYWPCNISVFLDFNLSNKHLETVLHHTWLKVRDRVMRLINSKLKNKLNRLTSHYDVLLGFSIYSFEQILNIILVHLSHALTSCQFLQTVTHCDSCKHVALWLFVILPATGEKCVKIG